MLCILLLLLPALSLACTNGCSGHGTCSGDYKQLCTCASGWTAPDCSLRTCPYGASWVGPSYSTDGLHSQTSECSNMVRCPVSFLARQLSRSYVGRVPAIAHLGTATATAHSLEAHVINVSVAAVAGNYWRRRGFLVVLDSRLLVVMCSPTPPLVN